MLKDLKLNYEIWSSDDCNDYDDYDEECFL